MERRQNYLRRNLGQKIGATLLSAGILIGGTESQANALVDYSLPKFDRSWHEGDHSPMATIHFNNNSAGFSVEGGDDLPQKFIESVDQSLSTRVIKTVIGETGVKSIIFQRSEADGGQWDDTQSAVRLFISDGHGPAEDRLYFDTRILKAALTHELMHSEANKWLQLIRGGVYVPQPTPGQRADIDAIQAASREVEREYLAGLPEPCIKYGSVKVKCTNERNDEYAREVYECIDEGTALQKSLELPSRVPLGHQENGLSETSASLLTNLAIDPTYTVDCFNENPSKFNTALRSLVKQILTITFKTSPELAASLIRSLDDSDPVIKLAS
jgi:hypothetical protein